MEGRISKIGEAWDVQAEMRGGGGVRVEGRGRGGWGDEGGGKRQAMYQRTGRE